MTMSTEQTTSNPFEQGGQAYARFRPTYPAQLAHYLAGLAPDRRLALDVGCGNGQLTALLAAEFAQVIGVDPSADQIANAAPTAGIRYECAPAERLPLADGSASLVTAAQAAHWFDLPAFYREVRRVGKPGAVLALISYGVLEPEAALATPFQAFYRDVIGPYWPPERKLVDSGYATIDFPFDEIVAPRLDIRLAWRLTEFVGYLETWSAVRNARQAGKGVLLQEFVDEISSIWGDPDTTRAIAWPINMRVGIL